MQLGSIWQTIRQWFGRSMPLLPPAPTAMPPPLPVEPAPRPRPKKENRNEDVFYFREHVLDKLDDYFVCIRRMKRYDSTAYSLFSKVGANLCTESSSAPDYELSPLWRTGERPGFGAVAWCMGVKNEPNSDTIYAKFCYFQKQGRRPHFVEPSTGTLYEFTVYWDDPDDVRVMKKGGVGQTVYFDIDKQCQIRMLKTLKPRTHPIVAKSAVTKRKQGSKMLRRLEWALPTLFDDYTPERYVRIFRLMSNFYEHTSSGARVAVTKDGVEAAFYIDIKRTPYFFADREPVIGNKGKKKIFHIVRAHKRVGAAGAERYVRFHFRGVRDFEWNGYQVHITMPGLHHSTLVDADISTFHYGEDEPFPPDTMPLAEGAKLMQKALHQ